MKREKREKLEKDGYRHCSESNAWISSRTYLCPYHLGQCAYKLWCRVGVQT